MRYRKFTSRAVPEYPTAPFENAEEAWFWFVRSQKLRDQGARMGDRSVSMVRPCDPDDLYRAVVMLAKGGRIGAAHIGVLSRFGLEDRPPDPRCREEERAARLWDEALDRLSTVLRKKGIVRIEDEQDSGGPECSWGGHPDRDNEGGREA